MIKLYLSCIALLISFKGMTQIQKVDLPEIKKIGVVTYMGQFLAELNYTTIRTDTTFCLLFDNAKYSGVTDLVRVKFENSPSILDTLYNILNDGFNLEKGKQSTFYLGKEFIAVSSDKAMGIKFIQVMALDTKAYFYLRKKQLNELFNRPK